LKAMENSSSASDLKSGFILFLFSFCGSFLISLIVMILRVNALLFCCCFYTILL